MNPDLNFGLSANDLTRIIELLRSVDGVSGAKIFGSRAKGNFREGSDIDIALIAPNLNHDHYLRTCAKIDDLMLPYKVDLVILHQIDNDSLLDHIQRVGIDIL